MGLLLVLFGCVALVLCLVSYCLIPFSSHKSCGVFQVSVEGHWTYSRTYVLVLRVFTSLSPGLPVSERSVAACEEKKMMSAVYDQGQLRELHACVQAASLKP